jgi:hypothetical protein
MADDYTIRVDAGDLADIIADRMSARADLETCIRDATEGAVQRDETIHELLSQFNGFRRAVQEATGLDQPELLHDDELVARIRRPYTVFNIDRAAVTDVSPNPWPDVAEKLSGLSDVSVEIKGVFAGAEWTVPEQDGPPVKQDVDPAWLDRAQQRVGEQLAGGARTFPEPGEQTVYLPTGTTIVPPGQSAALPDDGPPTETMPAVEEPPAVGDGYKLGRVFVRGQEWDDNTGDLMPEVLITRVCDWWEFSHIPDGAPSGDDAVYNCAVRELTHTFAELLHMHGTLWEVLGNSEQSSVAEQALVDDEKPPAKPNLHVATVYTSQQDGGSRWYELSDGWVVCASTLQNAQRDYPDLALSLTAVQDAHRDLRNEGIATS